MWEAELGDPPRKTGLQLLSDNYFAHLHDGYPWYNFQSMARSFRQKSSSLDAALAATVLGLVGFLPSALGQAVINVAGATSQFQSWKLSSGASIIDVQNDQQTGLFPGDFMGLAAGATGYSTTPASAVPSSMVTAGTIGGVDYLVFRFRMTDFNGGKNYVGSAVSVGIGFNELSGPGVTTIYATVDSGNAGQQLFFQGGGSGLNDGPSTTTLDGGAFAGNPYTKAAPLLLTSGTNWSYDKVTAFGDTNYDRTATSGTDNNAYVTFAIKFSDLQAATRALTGSTTFTVNYSTVMAFVGWTATQTQSINQDVNGTAGIPTSTWSAMGAFTDYVDATGKKPVVPEAATVVQVGIVLLLWGGRTCWRRLRAVVDFNVSSLITPE